MAQVAGGDQPSQTVNATIQSRRPMVCFQDIILEQRTCYEIAPDHRFDVRMTNQQRTVALEHGYRSAFSERHGCEEIFELGELNASKNDAQKLAFRPGQPSGHDHCPGAGETIEEGFAQSRCQLWV